MKPDQRALSIGIAVLLAVVFFVDTRMGLGFTPWLLYVIPLGLTYWSSHTSAPLIVAGLCSVLTIVGYHLAPPLVPPYIAITNRTFGIVMLWGLACLVMAYQVLVRRLSLLTIELRQELKERTLDLGRAVTAISAMASQGLQGSQQTPMSVTELKRQVADVLIAESRRLHEQVRQLEQEHAPEPGEQAHWEDTRRELERLSQQLEQLQQELLHS